MPAALLAAMPAAWLGIELENDLSFAFLSSNGVEK
jgi:hypothetical protein